MLSIQNNIAALNANRRLGINAKKNKKTTEKLSSGYRINRAADDAAGLAISEKMRRQIRGLHQAAENIQEGVGYVQTAEGALSDVHDMLQRMNELAVKAANGTCTEDDRSYIDQEIQQLKSEMDRIFDTTTFNEQRIWEPKEKKQIGVTKRQAVEFVGSSTQYNDVTNANCGVLACSQYATGKPDGYLINADENGVFISWMGWDGNDYKTETIDWDTLKAQNYSFDMGDYFGAADPGNLLYDKNGNPVFHNQISFQPEETATVDDIIACINQTRLSAYTSASMSVRFEQKDTNSVSYPGVSVNSPYLYYAAAYASYRNAAQAGANNGHNFDSGDDTFLEPSDTSGTLIQATGSNLTASPSATTAADARQSSETWTFSFYMNGIGTVTATSPSISYYAPSDTADDDEHYWWHWDWYYSNGQRIDYKAANTITSNESGTGTLASVMNTLTGEKGTKTPGLLTQKPDPTLGDSGDCDHGGYIHLDFKLVADKEFTYADNRTSRDVGSFRIDIRVEPTDTEQSVLDKIRNALNADTILDFQTNSAGNDSSSVSRAYAKRHIIDAPIWGGTCQFYVQAGTEAGQHITISYDSLSIIELEMENTNTLTRDDALTAIEDIKSALKVVNKQRSDFGAYQNRLEHAININKNTEENTQAAESVIRDTDMAKTMMEFSNNNILLQAGHSMLTQANQASDGVLYLLR